VKLIDSDGKLTIQPEIGNLPGLTIHRIMPIGGGLTNFNKTIDKLTRVFDPTPDFGSVIINSYGEKVAGKVFTLLQMLVALFANPVIGPTNYTNSDTEGREMVKTEQSFLKDLKSELAKKGIGSNFTYEDDGTGGFIMNLEVYEPTDTPGVMQETINDLINSNPNYQKIQVDSF